MRRRDVIKPNLHKHYSSLCASHVHITTYLFGDNLQSQLNNIRASNKFSSSKATVLKPHHMANGAPTIQTLEYSPERSIFCLTAANGKTPTEISLSNQKESTTQARKQPLTTFEEVNITVLDNIQVSTLEKDVPLLV